MLELVAELATASGMVVMVALHDLIQTLRYCVQTSVIADGRLCAAGPTDKVVTPQMLARTYAVRARIEPRRMGCPVLIVDGPLHDAQGRDILFA